MAKNYSDRPELARESQDVNAMPRRLNEAETFFGRGIHPHYPSGDWWQQPELICIGDVGGAANTTRPSQEDVVRAREENRRMEQQARQSSRDRVKGLADKGKDMLKKGSKGQEK